MIIASAPLTFSRTSQTRMRLSNVRFLRFGAQTLIWLGKQFDVLEVWKGMAKNVRGVTIPECGDLPQDEQPAPVSQELRDFLSCWKGRYNETCEFSCRGGVKDLAASGL